MEWCFIRFPRPAPLLYRAVGGVSQQLGTRFLVGPAERSDTEGPAKRNGKKRGGGVGGVGAVNSLHTSRLLASRRG